MTLFDSHCHLTDERLYADASEVVARARRAGVERLVTIASDAEDAAAAASLADAHAGVWASAGIHPHVAEAASAAALVRVRDLLSLEHVVAVGETGLDYHYDNAPRARQRAAFAAHLELGAELELPVVVHSRDADADTAELLERHPGATGVLHCFAGGGDLLERGLAAGWYVSFSGLVTFPRFAGRELVARVPADRVLIETDSPYLAPPPHRGRRNEPAYVAHVAEEVARLRGVSTEELARVTWDNACRLYRLEPERGDEVA